MKVLNRDGMWVDPDDLGLPRKKYAPDRILTIAKFQKAVLLCILVYVGLLVAMITSMYAISPEAYFYFGLLFAVLAVFTVYFVYQLSTALFTPTVGILVGVLMFFPCVSLIALLVINQKATTALRSFRIRVGLFGASRNDLSKLGPD